MVHLVPKQIPLTAHIQSGEGLITHHNDAMAQHQFKSDKFIISGFVIGTDKELKLPKHVATKGYRIRLPNVISLTGSGQTQPDLA